MLNTRQDNICCPAFFIYIMKKIKLNGRVLAKELSFEVFAQLHPIEAYYQNKRKFCKYMRNNGFDLTDDEIKKLIISVESPIK